MKRALILLLTVGLTVGALAISGAGAQGADPLRPGSGGVLIPYFTRADGRYFLILASPKGSNASLRLKFFDTSGSFNDIPVSLSTNDTQVIDITSLNLSVSEGSILITEQGEGVPQKAPIIARGLWVDGTGATRVIDPAIGRAAGPGGDRWSPFDAASAYIWAPRDDGIEGEARVLFSCPVGALAFAMDQVGPPFPQPTGFDPHRRDDLRRQREPARDASAGMPGRHRAPLWVGRPLPGLPAAFGSQPALGRKHGRRWHLHGVQKLRCLF